MLINLLQLDIRQFFAVFTGTLVAASDGMSFGWTSPMVPYLLSNETHIQTTEEQAEWLETTSLVGAFCGLPFTIYFVDKIGRKKSLLLAAVVVLLNWLAIGLGDRIEYIFVARFFAGMAGDMSFVAAPMYIAEIADSKIRGFLSSIIYIMMLLGLILVYILGPYAPFYAIPVAGAILASVQLLIFTFQPESPYYLIYKNKPEKAKESLRRLRAPGADLDKEMKEISAGIERQKKEKGRPQDLFLVRSNRKAIFIMAVLNVGQHMACISVMYMNLHPILNAAGSIYLDNNITAIVFAIIMLLASLFSSCTIDKFGRKKILIVSSTLSTICLLALSVYFHLQYLGYDVTGVSWIPIASVLVYAAAFKYGLGLVPIVITAEIFPAKMKAIGMTVADVMFVIGGILSIQCYQILHEFGMHVPFYLFSLCALLVSLYCGLCIPETKGKSLEEIQLMLKGEKVISKEVKVADAEKENRIC
ncbi:facilitated trehalose transporter Tret1-like isoform X2 [Anthonomus grandis grandis]|uniref:facilitated trehalose transporter Tret1-like isoform X2 n=1 Tax=Anthonomus grandis grandis TaxID=2921223 RepID=UPI00216568D3|nr:facilitated trehalose transporter Tret1-like isoform X2 [Anthonomus grandis grandis]